MDEARRGRALPALQGRDAGRKAGRSRVPLPLRAVQGHPCLGHEPGRIRHAASSKVVVPARRHGRARRDVLRKRIRPAWAAGPGGGPGVARGRPGGGRPIRDRSLTLRRGLDRGASRAYVTIERLARAGAPPTRSGPEGSSRNGTRLGRVQPLTPAPLGGSLGNKEGEDGCRCHPPGRLPLGTPPGRCPARARSPRDPSRHPIPGHLH